MKIDYYDIHPCKKRPPASVTTVIYHYGGSCTPSGVGLISFPTLTPYAESERHAVVVVRIVVVVIAIVIHVTEIIGRRRRAQPPNDTANIQRITHVFIFFDIFCGLFLSLF